jgi:hypothetical protein
MRFFGPRTVVQLEVRVTLWSWMAQLPLDGSAAGAVVLQCRPPLVVT